MHGARVSSVLQPPLGITDEYIEQIDTEVSHMYWNTDWEFMQWTWQTATSRLTLQLFHKHFMHQYADLW